MWTLPQPKCIVWSWSSSPSQSSASPSLPTATSTLRRLKGGKSTLKPEVKKKNNKKEKEVKRKTNLRPETASGNGIQSFECWRSKHLNRQWWTSRHLQKWTIPGRPFLYFCFDKNCLWLESNRRSLVLKVTALPTVPQRLLYIQTS